VLLLQPLHRLKRRGLIIRHVLIPRIIKLLKLYFLGAFYCRQFLFLRDPHILRLPLPLERAELLKAISQLLGSPVLLISLSTFLQLIHYSLRIKLSHFRYLL
jgi:hypothetical protein